MEGREKKPETDPVSLQGFACRPYQESNLSLVLSWIVDYLTSECAAQPHLFSDFCTIILHNWL